MKRALRALATAVTALAVTAASAAATTVASDESGRVKLRERLDNVVAAGAVGAMVEVRDEHGVWRAASGAAELGTTRAVPVNGRFRVGSITKTFVATVILQLVDEGRLRLDDTVESWLPGVVPDGHRITVQHLLNHTSGLYDYQDTLPMPPKSDFLLDNRWRTWTATELIARGVANEPAFESPGSDFSYSNTGYLLLGQIIEVVTVRTYSEEIERRIIRPLRLRGTSLPGALVRIRGPHPHGYMPTLRDGELDLVDYTEMNPSLFGAGGEMISTTRDLNRFVDALGSGDLVPDHLLDDMRTPGIEGGTYGLGLAWHDTSCGVRIYGNDGDALAYQSWSYSMADGRRQVAIALTPTFRGDPDDAVDAFLDEAFCG